MRTAQDLLQELNAVDESTRIEAKRCSQVDREVIKTVCAFANEPGLGGGYLLLGVEKVGQSLFGAQYEVCGVPDSDKIQSDLASQCASMLNVRLRPQMSSERVNDKTVVVVHVPEAVPAEKPVYLSNLGLPRGAMRRVGATDQESTEDDLLPLYAGRQVETYDMSLVPDGSWRDLDPDAIADYRTQRAKVNPEAEELQWNDEDLMLALSAARLVGKELKPTVAGVLLFGSSMALRRCFPMMRVDYIRVPGRQWVENPDKRFDTVEIRAPLLTTIRRAIAAVTDDLLKSFALPPGEIQSQEQAQLPQRVIREAIVNAIMHRSYRIHGAVQIIRYANRLEIRNPGHSLKAEEALGQPGSETRNPKIAAVLHEVKAAETKGSGIRVMRQIMREHDLLLPTFDSSRSPDQFVATFLFHHLLGEADLRWVRSMTDEALSDEEVKALIFVRETGAIDNASYREINGAETLDASVHLRRLRDLGLLTMKGAGNKTYYIPGEGFRAKEGGNGQRHQPEIQTHQPEAQTHQPETQTHQPEAQRHQLERQLPETLKARLPVPSSRPPEDAIRSLMLELCAVRPWNASELLCLLGRKDRKQLVRAFLSPMVEEGLLAYTIPQMVNHPEQRYTVPEKEVAAPPAH